MSANGVADEWPPSAPVQRRSSLEWRRIDDTRLYGPFRERCVALFDAARDAGAVFFVTSGPRTYAEQTLLYAQGRTSPGVVVTQAQAGESAHNFGIAIDVCRDASPDIGGLQPDWQDESYEILGDLAREHGLVWGGDWGKPDRPHLQWPGFVTVEQLAPLRHAYETGGLAAAWAVLDAS